MIAGTSRHLLIEQRFGDHHLNDMLAVGIRGPEVDSSVNPRNLAPRRLEPDHALVSHRTPAAVVGPTWQIVRSAIRAWSFERSHGHARHDVSRRAARAATGDYANVSNAGIRRSSDHQDGAFPNVKVCSLQQKD
jgi:hypothetical protein